MCRHPPLGSRILVDPCTKSCKVKMCPKCCKGIRVIPHGNKWTSKWPGLINCCTKVIYHITPCSPTSWIQVSQAHHCLQKVSLMCHAESFHVPAFSDTKLYLTYKCHVDYHRHAEIANDTIPTSPPMVRPLLDSRHGPTAILDIVIHVWQEPGGQVVPPIPMTAKWVWFKVNPSA